MNFQTLLEQLIHDTGSVSLPLFGAELALCGTIVALLFVRLFGAGRLLPPYWVALVGTLVGFWFVYMQFYDMRQQGDLHAEMFTGLLVYDKFTVFFRLFLL